MTHKQMMTPDVQEVKVLAKRKADFMVPMMRQLLQQVLEGEMDQALGAKRSERAAGRLGYRSGYYHRTLITRVGKIELAIPQDREGRFSTEIFERYQRSEKALVSALAEMYIQGVSTRKVKEITEQLCGHAFSRSVISQINKKLDHELSKFARRLLEVKYPYVVLDARYEKVRIDGVIRTQAVLVAVGVTPEGRREVLGVELANRESLSSWEHFLIMLKQRGLHGVEHVVSDDHPGLKGAIGRLLPEACWQRCYVHFLRNALDYLPRKVQDDCLTELKWLYDRRDLAEAHRDLQAWLVKWQPKHPKLCEWVEENIEETFTFYRLPREHHKHMKSTNMLERQNQELKRRTQVVRIFPNEASCLRLVRAIAQEIHEDWIEDHRYLDMELLEEHKKLMLTVVA